jgi:hypothetical protein
MNPLCWLAHDRLIVERERACDDRVLATGTRPSRYATALLDIAREAVAPRSPLAVAALPVSTSMVRGSALAARLQRVLDPRRSHAVLGRRAIGALAGAALLLALPAACLVGDPADPTPRLRLTYQVAPQHLAETTRVLKRRVDLLNLDGPRIAREGAHLLVDLPAAPEARTAGAWKQSLARSGRLKLVIVESQGDYLDRLTRALAADAGGRAAGLRAHPPTPASEDGRRPGAPGYLQGPGPALERFLAQLPPALAAEPGHRLLVHWDEDLRAHRTIYLDERRQIVLSRFAEAEVRDASDSIGPQWFQVQILLHPEDGAVLDRLTRANLGEQMAVLMDGEQLWGTPTIRAPFGVRVSVTMTGDAAEAERLATAFRAGALPAPLTLVSEESPR